MLSKLIRGDRLDSVQPFTWQKIADSPVPERQQGNAESPGEDSALIQALKERVAELESLLDKRVKESRETGLREGIATGKSQGAAEVKPVIEKMAQSIQQLADYRPGLRSQAEADIVKLALAIARKVVNRELSIDPEAIVGLVRVALEKLRLQEVVRVRVHPTHQANVKELLGRSANGLHVDVAGDPTVGIGGLVFESNRGEFDASIEVHLNEIERGLTDRLAG